MFQNWVNTRYSITKSIQTLKSKNFYKNISFIIYTNNAERITVIIKFKQKSPLYDYQ